MIIVYRLSFSLLKIFIYHNKNVLIVQKQSTRVTDNHVSLGGKKKISYSHKMQEMHYWTTFAFLSY